MVARREGGWPEKEKARADVWAFWFFGGGDQMAFLLEITVDRGFWRKLTLIPFVSWKPGSSVRNTGSKHFNICQTKTGKVSPECHLIGPVVGAEGDGLYKPFIRKVTKPKLTVFAHL